MRLLSNIWKKRGGIWGTVGDVIDYSLNEEFGGDINNINRSILYMPVHNSDDIYEWYRIFNDAYLFKDLTATNYIDNIGHGVGITLYSNCDRAKTIKAWFPNLVEVKAISSDVFEYTYDGVDILRRSVDYIDNYVFGVEDNLYIDGTLINVGERVLLKNQYIERLWLFGLAIGDLSGVASIYGIDNVGKNIRIIVDSTVIKNYDTVFRDGGIFVGIKGDGTIVEYDIVSVFISDASVVGKYFLDIRLGEFSELLGIEYCADKVNGIYEMDESMMIENGVYTYTGTGLVRIEEMGMTEKVYNQLVYGYQGKTNMNKTYYLRRHEGKHYDVGHSEYDVMDPFKINKYYGKYPCDGYELPFRYSLGNPQLIECEVTYDVAMQPLDFSAVDMTCSSFNNSYNYLAHPSHDGPYTWSDNIFRLLYLDYNMARKLQSKSKIGPADYTIKDDLVFYENGSVNVPETIKFDVSTNIYNYLNKYVNKIGANFVINDITFHAIKLSNIGTIITELSDCTLHDVEADILIDGTMNKITIDLDSSYGSLSLPYNEGFIRLRIDVMDGVDVINSFDSEIYVNMTKIGTVLELDIVPGFDKNMVDDLFLNYNNDPLIVTNIGIEFISSFIYDDNLLPYTDIYDNEYMNNFINSVNKTILGHVYDFGYKINVNEIINPDNSITKTLDNITLKLNKIRNNFNTYIYDDMTQSIELYIGGNTLSSEIVCNYKNVYGPNYTISEYMNYIDLPNVLLETRTDMQLNFNDDITSPLYCKIIESNKHDDFGTVLELGFGFKQYVLENIKEHSYYKVVEHSNLLSYKLVFVNSVEYDYETKIARIVFNNLINGYEPGTNDYIHIDPAFTLTDLSDIYESNFNINHNIANNSDYLLPIDEMSNYSPILPSTYAVANDIINSREHFFNLTGVVYKEFNEPVYTFFKRDKKFRFDNYAIIDITSILVNSVTYTEHYYSGTTNIEYLELDIINDGSHLYVVDDLILLCGQLDIRYNGIYKVVTVNASSILVTKQGITNNAYYKASTGLNNGSMKFVTYDGNYLSYITPIYTYTLDYRKKNDLRLNITFLRTARLGVDNDYQPFIPINHNRDSIEVIENIVSVSNNINAYNAIRFIDGLSYNNIINNIDGQGQFAWILHENVVTENAVVGKMIDPITGLEILVWYKGKWVDGVWCNGIWIQGEWINGVWVNGQMYSYGITDNILTVTINYSTIIENLTVFKNGTWYNGIHYNGIMENVDWKNGTLKGGRILTGYWENGTVDGHYNPLYNVEEAVIEHIYWKNGTFNKGYFNKGYWENGIFNDGVFGSEAYLSNEYSDRAIFIKGIINAGTFTTKNNEHNATIIYTGKFTGTLNSGTLIFVDINGSTINDGVYIGGYYSTLTPTGTTTKIDYTPSSWDVLLGLTTLNGYIPNTNYMVLPNITEISILGKSDVTNVPELFVNEQFNSNYNISLSYNINVPSGTVPNYIEINKVTVPMTFSTNNDYPFITVPITDHTTIINGGVFFKGYAFITGANKLNFNGAVIYNMILNNCNIN